MENQAVEKLLERRSVRNLDPDRQISEEELQTLLQIASTSPSAHNNQRYHFSAVQDRKLLDHMAELIRQHMLEGSQDQRRKASTPGYSPLHHAPTVLFVSGDLDASFHVQTDCGIAAGLVVAAAEEMGLSSCVTASSLFMFESDEGQALKERLHIPEGYRTVCAIALGYRKGDKPAEPEHKSKEELVTAVR